MLASTCSTREMRAWEVNSAALGVPTRLLMENAGATVARVVVERFKPKRVSVVAGVGGKAGDGLVAARHLATYGIEVRVYLVYRRESIKHPDTLDALKAAEVSGVEIIEGHEKWLGGKEWLDADLVIDAMLGTGVKGDLREPYRRIVEEINRSGIDVVAIDVPTGIDPDTGTILGTAIRARVTVTMHCVKKGLTSDEARSYTGDIIVANIGLPRDAWLYVGPGDLEAFLPRRPEWARKGQSGRILVVGGSRWFYGAPWIASLAAFYAGADLVYLAAPEPVLEKPFSPEVIPVPLTGSHLRPEHLEELKEYIERADVILVGPGISTHPEALRTARLVARRALEGGKLVVIDADGIKALASYDTPGDRLASLEGRGVITPHAGEASLLLGGSRISTLDERIEAARRLAERLKAVVVLKGRIDVIASPTGAYRLNRSGTPDMTAGGTGDVLSGVIAGLLGEAKDPWIAALLGSYVTGIAGEQSVASEGRAAPLNLLRYVARELARVRYK